MFNALTPALSQREREQALTNFGGGTHGNALEY